MLFVRSFFIILHICSQIALVIKKVDISHDMSHVPHLKSWSHITSFTFKCDKTRRLHFLSCNETLTRQIIQKRKQQYRNGILPFNPGYSYLAKKKRGILRKLVKQQFKWLDMALKRLNFRMVIFSLAFELLLVPVPTKVASDSTTEFKPTQPGVKNPTTDPPWMSRPGMKVFHMLKCSEGPMQRNTSSKAKTFETCSLKSVHKRHAMVRENGSRWFLAINSISYILTRRKGKNCAHGKEKKKYKRKSSFQRNIFRFWASETFVTSRYIMLYTPYMYGRYTSFIRKCSIMTEGIDIFAVLFVPN